MIQNAGDEFTEVVAQRTTARTVLAGLERGDLQARDIVQTASGAEFSIVEGAHFCRAALPVPGLHMAQNALLAVAAGRIFGLSLEECAAGLAAAPLARARLQIKNIGGVQFIDDSYNANPTQPKLRCALAELEPMDGASQFLAKCRSGAESTRGHEKWPTARR